MLALLLALGVGGAPAAAPPKNVLVVLLDDVSVYDVTGYGEGADPAPTPRLDALAVEGVRFRNAWANPNCSPTRAALLTGRQGFRTGVGKPVDKVGNYAGLPLSEVLLPEALPDAYATALIGKWHLSGTSQGVTAPNDHGFDHFAGHLFNPTGGTTYWDLPKVVDGVEVGSTVYATTDQVDDALAWIARAPEPWFCVLSLTAAHEPFHCAPEELLAEPCEVAPGSGPTFGVTTRDKYKSMVEALDTEVGRLLDSIEADVLDRTTVLALGDNGTPKPAAALPVLPWKAKHTMYHGGVRVPLVVWGAGVPSPGEECAAPVQATDVFATVLELAEAPFAPRGIDSVSLLPYLRDPTGPARRAHVFAERFNPNGTFHAGTPPPNSTFAVSDGVYKLHRHLGAPRLFHLPSDPLETVDLAGAPAHAAAEAALTAALDARLASPALLPDADALSLATGAELGFTLETGPGYQGLAYLVLGSLSGTSPGTAVDGVVLPLVWDAYADLSLVAAGTPGFDGTVGTLDLDGRATATVHVPPGADPGLAGGTLAHAALVFGPVVDAVWASAPAVHDLLP